MSKETKSIGNNGQQPTGNEKEHLLDRYAVKPQASGGANGNDSSPFYKSQAPTIELPKGGGAIKGIDEKFSVNAVNGTTSLEIPLPITPGRGDFSPKLSVQYNSGGGNSEFGQGWGLSLPSIQRKTDKKLPEYKDYNDSDVFLLAGAEDLVPHYIGEELDVIYPEKENTSPAPNTVYRVKRYVPRIEGLYARIEFITELGSNGSWWRVTTKDNIVTYYGLTDNGRVADPDNAERIFKWLPQFSYDRKGNIQVYVYASENTDNIPAVTHEAKRKSGAILFANTYLKRVLYCNETPFSLPDTHDVYRPDLPISENFLMELVLDYGEHDLDFPKIDDDQLNQWHCRKDPFSDFHAGFEIRTYRRCYRALMYHKFSELIGSSGEDAVLVKSLELEYNNGNTSAGNEEFTETDFINSCILKGYKLIEGTPNTYISKSLPAITYEYQPLVWDNTIENVSKKDAENIPQGLTGNYQWIDFEGEGLPGVLTEQGRGWFYKHNLGDGKFAPNIQVASKPSFVGLGQQLQWQDLDADGRRHLVSNNSMHPGYFELDDDQEWQSFKSFKDFVNIDWQSPYTKMLDLDGDGRPDALITEDRVWKWYKNKGTEGYSVGGDAPKTHNDENGPQLLINDKIQSIFLADINGDGMTDIVRVQNGEVCYWPNMGYGVFGKKVLMSNAPVFDRPEMFNPIYLSLNDISGTGAVDIIYIGQNKCTAWINYAGNAWSEPISIGPLPGIEQYSKIAIMDFLGSGTSCIVWSSPLPQHAHAPLRYIDLMGGDKPYLMKSYSNGMGKTTQFTYKHSTKYYIEDKLAGTPWATKLPFPVHCIEKVTTLDEVSETQYTQSYAYHHGYYDHDEREFRGFGRVDVTDIEKADAFEGIVEADLEQEPVLTKTWYHTGAWLREATLITHFEGEYFNVANWNLAGLAAYPDGLNTQEIREAHRALKGKPLRQEVYALDATDQEDKPYTVTAYSYIVKLLQFQLDNRYASFLSHEQEKAMWHCERDITDARVLHEMVLEVDEYGNVVESAKVAYKRSSLPTIIPGKEELYAELISNEEDEEAEKLLLYHSSAVTWGQGTTLVSYTVNSYTNDVIDERQLLPSPQPATTLIDNYKLRVLCEERIFELHGLTHPTDNALWHPADLKATYHGIGSGDEIEFSETPVGLQKRLLSHKRIVYAQDDASGYEELGTQGARGLLYQQYQLAITDHMLSDAANYNSKVNNTMLTTDGAYLQESTLTEFGGGGSATNYWLPSGTMGYDVTPENTFYTPLTYTDPWGNDTTINYGANYYLLPSSVTDALNSVMTVNDYDWRCLQPTRITDMNDNESEVFFDTLCMAVAVAMKGKTTSGFEADELGSLNPDADSVTQTAFWSDPKANAATLLGHATWRCVYDLSSQPSAVAMIAREEHYQDNTSSPLLIRATYTDGFGRIAMHKAQVPDYPGTTDERWLASGKTVYNNKGKTVMQYEPYYTDSFTFDSAEDAGVGVTPRMYYDPLGRLYRTELPDGSYTKTEWDAWHQKNYDNNDTVVGTAWEATMTLAGGNYADAATKAARHNDTPTIVLLDTLAQPFYTIQHDRYDVGGTQTDFYYNSYVQLDMLGNRLAIQDARMATGTFVLQYKYNMLKGVIKQNSADSGTQFMLNDVDNQPLYAWDAEDREFFMQYDVLRRLIEKSVDDGSVATLEVLEYGEGITDDKLNNLRGQLYKYYDGTGLKTVLEYDFKGNAIDIEQKLLQDYTIADVNWNTGAVPITPTIDTEVFSTSAVYDALNRVVNSTDDGGNLTENTYDEGGMLLTVTMTPNGASAIDFVTNIEYNAKGQRTVINYGNGTKTEYTYDDNTFRLTNLVTNHNTDVHQDLKYWYDPVGNITRVKDDAHRALFFNNSVALPVQDFTYDALYRLKEAGGRELIGSSSFGGNDNYNDSAWMGISHKGNDNNTQNYTQKYSYDEVGNILSLQHIAGSQGYTRSYTYGSTNNRLLNNTTDNGTPTSYTSYNHDVHGNMIQMPHLATIDYNTRNQMVYANLGGGGDAYYQYDAGGQRTRKVVVLTGGARKERIYLGNYELYREYNSGGTLTLERATVHIADDTGRIAMYEKRISGTDGSAATLQRYIYSNHLSTASLELDDSAAIISYEEYHPFGTTAYQAMDSSINAVAKRYRYTGKERDEETGLYYHGARYYLPWLCRWAAVDPKQNEMPDWSSYNYGYNNPIKWYDSTGNNPDDPQDNDNTEKNNEYNEESLSGTDVYSTSGEYLGNIPGDSPFEIHFIDLKKISRLLPGMTIGIDDSKNIIENYRDKDKLTQLVKEYSTAYIGLKSIASLQPIIEKSARMDEGKGIELGFYSEIGIDKEIIFKEFGSAEGIKPSSGVWDSHSFPIGAFLADHKYKYNKPDPIAAGHTHIAYFYNNPLTAFNKSATPAVTWSDSEKFKHYQTPSGADRKVSSDVERMGSKINILAFKTGIAIYKGDNLNTYSNKNFFKNEKINSRVNVIMPKL